LILKQPQINRHTGVYENEIFLAKTFYFFKILLVHNVFFVVFEHDFPLLFNVVEEFGFDLEDVDEELGKHVLGFFVVVDVFGEELVDHFHFFGLVVEEKRAVDLLDLEVRWEVRVFLGCGGRLVGGHERDDHDVDVALFEIAEKGF